MKRALLALAGLALVGGAVALAPRLLRQGNEALAREVQRRLEAAAGGQCKVGAVELVSRTEATLSAVGCVLDEGSVLAFGAARVAVAFARAPMGRGLPPLRSASVDGLQVRLRGKVGGPAFVAPPGARDADGERDDEGGLDLSRDVVELAQRLDQLGAALREGKGGQLAPAVVARLADGGTLRVERASIETSTGEVVVRDGHAELERAGPELLSALVARPASGGLVALEGRLSERGLSEAALRIEDLPVAEHLDEALGEQADVLAGTASGRLLWDGGDWSVDATLDGLVLQAPALGKQELPLPPIGVQGTLQVDAEELAVLDGRWSLAGEGGAWTASLGPLRGEAPRAQATLTGEGLALGTLLGSLPDALLPQAWAAEIRGTMDLSVELVGDLHDRSTWTADWDANFDRLTLASGELARQIERLGRSFEHTLPGPVAEGAPTTRIIGPEDERYVPLRSISKHLVAAVLSTEDNGFFRHSGFEVEQLKEAVLENLREGGGRGGSTITQQLAKNLFLSGERTFARKLKEAVLAWRMETVLPKERILELYLNIAEWGPGLYGASEAADHYFGRTPARLEPEEAAFLASLLPAPRRFHRYYHSPRGLTKNRHERVQEILRAMHRMGRLSDKAYHLARGNTVELAGCPLPPEQR